LRGSSSASPPAAQARDRVARCGGIRARRRGSTSQRVRPGGGPTPGRIRPGRRNEGVNGSGRSRPETGVCSSSDCRRRPPSRGSRSSRVGATPRRLQAALGTIRPPPNRAGSGHRSGGTRPRGENVPPAAGTRLRPVARTARGSATVPMAAIGAMSAVVASAVRVARRSAAAPPNGAKAAASAADRGRMAVSAAASAPGRMAATSSVAARPAPARGRSSVRLVSPAAASARADRGPTASRAAERDVAVSPEASNPVASSPAGAESPADRAPAAQRAAAAVRRAAPDRARWRCGSSVGNGVGGGLPRRGRMRSGPPPTACANRSSTCSRTATTMSWPARGCLTCSAERGHSVSRPCHAGRHTPSSSTTARRRAA